MIKRFTIFIYIFLCLIPAYPQLAIEGIPESFGITTKSAVLLPQETLPPIDSTKLATEDFNFGISNRYGELKEVSIDLKSEGVKTLINNKGYIWRYKIKSEKTFSLGIHFTEFRLPEGSKIFIYNESQSQIAGAFTKINNNEDSQLFIADFKGNNAIIEYFEPFEVEFQAKVKIGYVSQSYKDIFSILQYIIGINCPEGREWQLQKHAVCMTTYNEDRFVYYCSGALVNNVRNDAIPYFLTARHCISTNTAASSLVIYFNYESAICNGSVTDRYNTLSGSSLLSSSTYTDFALLRLRQTPPFEYEPYYAGWDATGGSSLNGTSIHHPEGNLKSIAIDNNAPTSVRQSISWDDGTVTTPNSHWQVGFDVGDVESGSSGCPLFNDQKRIIGQLHGGDDSFNYFGKFSISWKRSSLSTQQLAIWLDPDNTNTLVLDGFAATFKPEADFSSSLTSVCLNAPVTFYDNSKYLPTQWTWSFSPSSVMFINGTDNNSQFPEVIFLNEGTYDVSLNVSNFNGSDIITKNNYITAGGSLNVDLISEDYNNSICGPYFKDIKFAATGASQYVFKINDSNKFTYSVFEDTIVLSTKDTLHESFRTYLSVTGTQGTCLASDSVELNVLYARNDNVLDALELKIGDNGPYSNECASVQSNEPSPLTISCHLPNSWCGKSDGIVIHNTIWFKFSGPPNGSLTIDTRGFNDRISIYNAESAEDIVLGRPSLYKIIAANDSRSLYDSTALLKNVRVEPGKTYWMQLDGYNGATGEAYINLITNNIEVMPNPNNGEFDMIISIEKEQAAIISVYNIHGAKIFTQNINVSRNANRYRINLRPIASGIYIIGVNLNNVEQRKKIMILK